MTPSDQLVADPPAEEVPAEKARYASRDEILGAASHLQEEEAEIEGLGRLIFSELTGEARALVLGKMGTALEGTKLTDPKWTSQYHRTLLQNGIVDPESPRDARRPMFRDGDMTKLMQLGGGKIAQAIEIIERLSKMGRFTESAEGNSDSTLNGDSTSG